MEKEKEKKETLTQQKESEEKKRRREEKIDQGLEQTFPASDPPSFSRPAKEKKK